MTTVVPIAASLSAECKDTASITLDQISLSAECTDTASVTLDQISDLIDKKLGIVSPTTNNRDKSFDKQKDSLVSRQNERNHTNVFEPKTPPKSPVRQRRTLNCSYCKRTNHTFDNCYLSTKR